jgi:hypothetical protein
MDNKKWDAALDALAARIEARVESTLDSKLESKLAPIRNDVAAVKHAVKVLIARQT